jgi:hypothetical protein
MTTLYSKTATLTVRWLDASQNEIPYRPTHGPVRYTVYPVDVLEIIAGSETETTVRVKCLKAGAFRVKAHAKFTDRPGPSVEVGFEDGIVVGEPVRTVVVITPDAE